MSSITSIIFRFSFFIYIFSNFCLGVFAVKKFHTIHSDGDFDQDHYHHLLHHDHSGVGGMTNLVPLLITTTSTASKSDPQQQEKQQSRRFSTDFPIQQQESSIRAASFTVDPLIIIALIALPTIGMLGLSSLIMPLIPIGVYMIQQFFPTNAGRRRRRRRRRNASSLFDHNLHNQTNTGRLLSILDDFDVKFNQKSVFD